MQYDDVKKELRSSAKVADAVFLQSLIHELDDDCILQLEYSDPTLGTAKERKTVVGADPHLHAQLPHPLLAQYLLTEGNEWDGSFVMGMINFLNIWVHKQNDGKNNKNKKEIQHVLESSIRNPKEFYEIKAMEGVEDLIIILQEQEHYFVVHINLETKVVKFFDDNTANLITDDPPATLVKLLATHVRKFGSSECLKEKDCQFEDAVITQNYKLDCAANALVSVMRLIEYTKQRHVVHYMDRRWVVFKAYLELFLENKHLYRHIGNEEGRLVKERNVPVKSIIKLFEIMLEKIETLRTSVSKAFINKCAQCGQKFITKETKEEMLLQYQASVKKDMNVYHNFGHEVLASFDIIIPFCCFRRFHSGCFPNHKCTLRTKAKKPMSQCFHCDYHWDCVKFQLKFKYNGLVIDQKNGGDNDKHPTEEVLVKDTKDGDGLVIDQKNGGDNDKHPMEEVLVKDAKDGDGHVIDQKNGGDNDKHQMEELLVKDTKEKDTKDSDRTKVTERVTSILKDRTGKLIPSLKKGQQFDKDRDIPTVQGMFNVAELLTMLDKTDEDRVCNVIRALDPMQSDACEYTGITKYRILTLRKTGWLDCSVINHIAKLLCDAEYKAVTGNKINVTGSYWFLRKGKVTVGAYHVIICNLKLYHWVTIEVDDTANPRPNELTCRVFGLTNNTQFDQVRVEYQDKLSTRFGTEAISWQRINDAYQEEQVFGDCGIIALRRAEVLLQHGVVELDSSKFETLGSYELSRLLYTDMILRNNDSTSVKSSFPTPSKGFAGKGTVTTPLTLDTLIETKVSNPAKRGLEDVTPSKQTKKKQQLDSDTPTNQYITRSAYNTRSAESQKKKAADVSHLKRRNTLQKQYELFRDEPVAGWLNNRDDKLLDVNSDEYNGLKVGNMYNIEQMKELKKLLNAHDFFKVIVALDPLRDNECVYPGVEKYEILTLRNMGSLGKSVISRTIHLLQRKYYDRSDVRVYDPNWITDTAFIAPPGDLKVFVSMDDNSNWFCIEINDTSTPRPNKIRCRVIGHEGISMELKERLKENFKAIFGVPECSFLDSSVGSHVEECESSTSGIIALRRVECRLKNGVTKLEKVNFDSLGSVAASRILYTHMIISSTETTLRESADAATCVNIPFQGLSILSSASAKVDPFASTTSEHTQDANDKSDTVVSSATTESDSISQHATLNVQSDNPSQDNEFLGPVTLFHDAYNTGELVSDHFLPLPFCGTNGDVPWITPESVGLKTTEQIKGFYHGNLLFVCKAEEYRRASTLIRTIFVAPKLDPKDRFVCSCCKNNCPNYYVLLIHQACHNVSNSCESAAESCRKTPAFLLFDSILDVLDRTKTELFDDALLKTKKFDFLNPCAEYCIFACTNVLHESLEVRLAVRQERLWSVVSTSTTDKNAKPFNLLEMIYAKVTKTEALQQQNEQKSVFRVGCYPTILSMPFIDTEKATMHLKDPQKYLGLSELCINPMREKSQARGKPRTFTKRNKKRSPKKVGGTPVKMEKSHKKISLTPVKKEKSPKETSLTAQV